MLRYKKMAKTQDYHHGDLRNVLLDVAETQLRSDPRDVLSIRALAGKIGVSATAPHAHFKTKEDLLVALAVRGFERLRDRTIQNSVDAADPYEKMAALAEAYLEFSVENAGLYRIMFMTGLEVRASPELSEASLASYGVLETAVREAGIASSDEEARELAFAAWGLVHGFASLLTEGWVVPRTAPEVSMKELSKLVARRIVATIPS